jgi:hypothetical protein
MWCNEGEILLAFVGQLIAMKDGPDSLLEFSTTNSDCLNSRYSCRSFSNCRGRPELYDTLAFCDQSYLCLVT